MLVVMVVLIMMLMLLSFSSHQFLIPLRSPQIGGARNAFRWKSNNNNNFVVMNNGLNICVRLFVCVYVQVYVCLCLACFYLLAHFCVFSSYAHPDNEILCTGIAWLYLSHTHTYRIDRNSNTMNFLQLHFRKQLLFFDCVRERTSVISLKDQNERCKQHTYRYKARESYWLTS